MILQFTGLSGAGKTSITKFLLNNMADKLAFSVSATTRKPRAYEIDGKDYYFLTEQAFRTHITQNDFVEWEMVYEGKYYGTLKSEIAKIWNEGKSPLLDIDVKGAIHIRQQYPDNSLTLFIEPPSVEVLKERLLSRGTESAESLEARVNKAAYEITFKDQFDYVILNDELSRACSEAMEKITRFLSHA